MKQCLLILTLAMTACAQKSTAPPTASRPQSPSTTATTPATNNAASSARGATEDPIALPVDQTLGLMEAARPVLFPPEEATASSSADPQDARRATFRATSERIIPRLFARNLGADAALKARREAEFAGYLQSYEDRISRRGGRQHDLARAAGFFIAACHYAASGGTEFSQPQADALRLRLEKAVPAAATFKAMPDVEKQRLYETFVVLGQFFAVNHDAVARTGNAEDGRRLRGLAARHLERLTGTPYERIRFSERGMEF